MKKTILLLALLLSMMTMEAAVKIDRIDPTDWFVGMKDASLQLMVYGKRAQCGSFHRLCGGAH